MKRAVARTARLEVAVQYTLPRKGLPAAASVRRWVAAALAGQRRRAELTVRFVDAEEGQRLNREYRGKDYPTNVLSFAAEGPTGVPTEWLGDLALCAPVVAQEARDQGKPLAQHYAHLVVHGCLHLLGMDHQDDEHAEAMEASERRILAALGIPDPYAER